VKSVWIKPHLVQLSHTPRGTRQAEWTQREQKHLFNPLTEKPGASFFCILTTELAEAYVTSSYSPAPE